MYPLDRTIEFQMKTFRPQKIYVDASVLDTASTETILSRTSGIPVEYVSDVRAVIDEISSQVDPIGQGKKSILITRYKGKMLKPCPGTPKIICCNYHILNPVVGCPLDCTYCALQMYINNPLTIIFSNIEDLATFR